jgi:putative ABC transport system permease protein
MRRLILTETGILGVCAGMFAAPIGIGLAALLVFVINVRSFGWTMEFRVEPGALLPGLLLAFGAALLAGIAPAMRSYRGPVADALRHASN